MYVVCECVCMYVYVYVYVLEGFLFPLCYFVQWNMLFELYLSIRISNKCACYNYNLFIYMEFYFSQGYFHATTVHYEYV